MGSVEKRTRKLANGRTKTFYVARWREPSGRQATKSFPKKGLAEDHVTEMESDVLRGDYVSPTAGEVTFKEYAEAWLGAQTFNPTTRRQVGSYFKVHAYPALGHRALNAVKPFMIQAFIRGMSVADDTKALILVQVSAVFSAAVDDELIRKNPCKAKSVTKPRSQQKKIVPWAPEQVFAVRDALPDRYKILVTLGVGLGLRRGEIFGLAVEDFDFKRKVVSVRRQVKLLGVRVFALPKNEKTREVPLPAEVAREVKAHMAKYPPVAVTLPWKDVDGDPVTARLILTNSRHNAMIGSVVTRDLWPPALTAVKIRPGRENGCHMLRHVYASTLLHHGESIKALSEYLGHSSAGFTLRVYTHLMPGSAERTRRAVDEMFRVTRVERVPDEDANDQVTAA
ncbi:tyrosine-type recombinase/integrase [Myceligenerans salitolerans]|uniref:Site-specific integrase n=1 Tax=Myceligenerans salitolerans TaxID=1230528 RepID=A0ABS3I739_9MICO|nr:site-specific integrase [Myceligenerans salitolerans]MBO0608816.1 site-specific integrase [Myceligenerans salitolerans]